jgi:GxxExxY protein
VPIETSIPIRVISQDAFHAIDHVMLGHAFAVHNEYGRLLDESFYKSEVAHRCVRDGIAVKREVLIRVRHATFHKDYFIDMLLDGSTVIEGKVVEAIAPSHHGQALNYLLLAGTHHGSLVNFRPTRVQRDFVSTRLTHELRRRFDVSRHAWPKDDNHQGLEDIATAFCADVGLGLDLVLYRQAFASLLGGLSREPRPVAVLSEEHVVHRHFMHMLTEDESFAVTAMSGINDARNHLQRLLNHTRLRGMAWIHLPINEVRFEFLKNHGNSDLLMTPPACDLVGSR